MTDNTIFFFVEKLKDRIFKILPLKEEGNSYLMEYIDSLIIEMMGGYVTFPELQSNMEYLRVINTLQYMLHNDISVVKCKREIFKSIRCLNNIIDKKTR